MISNAGAVSFTTAGSSFFPHPEMKTSEVTVIIRNKYFIDFFI
jgi:hypothetical protein